MKICVFGASSDALAKEYFDAARRLGELMAKSGHTLVYGGGSDGLMRACADGVKSGGGAAIGVAPRMFDEGDFLRRDFGELIFTDTMAARKELMRSLAEAFIVLPGGTGFITDLGMTGPIDGILGVCAEDVIFKSRTHLPRRFTVASGEIRAHGALFDLDPVTGKVQSVKRVVF